MAAENLYPFSTARGDAIPLEIVKPKALISYAFTENVAQSIIIPADFTTCWIYATATCILRFNAIVLPDGLVNATEYSDALIIPPETPINVFVTPGDAQLLGLTEAGTVYINYVTQWAALNQATQTSFG
jgi:hypothetical protein